MTSILKNGGSVTLQPPTPQANWHNWSKRALLLTSLLVVTLAGCSGPGGEIEPVEHKPDQPKVIECSRGVPAADNKSCINAISCGTDSNKCLEGFACYRDTCRQIECGEGLQACSRGECSDIGICVSKSTCQAGDADNSCIDGEVCINRQCEPAQKCDALPACGTVDPACDFRKTVCIETNPCTGADSCRSTKYCNPTTQRCEDNKCILPTGEKDCAAEEGGICNKATGACESAEVCTSASECLDSADLNVKKVCTVDLNDASATDKKCQIFRDVCQAACRTQANCVYDETSLKMTCGDGTCSVMDDCGVNEYCNNGTCEAVDSYQCVADSLEGTDGNNDQTHATDFTANQTNGIIKDLSLCKDDVDVFVVDDLSPYIGADKLLIVDLQYDKASKGRKVKADLTVELVEVDAGSPGVETLMETMTLSTFRVEGGSATEEHHDGVLYFKTLNSVLDASKKNKAYITVKYDTSNASDLGVDYSLKVRHADEGVFEMCKVQTPLVFVAGTGYTEASLRNQNLTTAPTSAATFPSNPSCTDSAKDIKELAYSFTVEGSEPKKVEISAIPKFSSGLDVALVVLRNCESGIIDTNPLGVSGCRQERGEGVAEGYEGLLEPGEYTIVVTAKSTATLGTGVFDLSVTQYPTPCNPATDNICASNTEKQLCDPFLTNLRAPEACPAGEQCVNYGNGAVGCTSDFGSVCASPHVFTKATPLTGMEFDTKSMKGQKSGNSQFTCDGKLDRGQVSGGEVYLRGVIEPGQTAIVKAKPDATDPVAVTIYTMSKCDATTCGTASYFTHDETPAVLTHTNSGTAAEEVIFVVETNDKGGKVAIDAEVIETTSLPSCVPGKTTCDKSDPLNEKMTICVDDGTGTGTYVEKTTTCLRGLGCDDTALAPACVRGGESCDAAYPLLPGVAYSFKLADFSDSLGKVNNCTRQPSGSTFTNTGSNDFVFKVDADANDLIRVKVKGNIDLVLWQIDGDCSTLTPATPQCKAISDRSGGTYEAPEMLEVISDGNPAYFVVERFNSSKAQASHQIEVYAEVIKPDCSTTISKPTCNVSTGKITFCDAEDKLHTKVCPNGCLESPARCAPTSEPDLAEGLNCGSPMMLTNTTTPQRVTRKLGGLYYNNNIELSQGLVGECSLQAKGSYAKTTENDAIYAIQLAAGEVLEYRVSSDSTAELTNAKVRVYVVDETCTANGCRNMRDGDFIDKDGNPTDWVWHKYHSRATGANKEAVYLVVDAVGDISSAVNFDLEYKVSTSSTPDKTEESYWSHCEGNNVVFAKGDGTWQNVTCPTGTACANGVCKPNNTTTGDQCDDASILEHNAPGVYVLETSNKVGVVDYTNGASPKCGAAKIDAAGSDYFFKIKVPAGAILSVIGMSGSNTKPTVYIGETCTKIKSNDPDACLASSVGAGSGYRLADAAIAEYKNSTGSEQTVVVGLDSAQSPGTPSDSREPIYYMVDIVTTPTCTVTNEITCATDAVGQARLYQCVGGQQVELPGGECNNNACTVDGKACLVPGDNPLNAIPMTPSATLTTTPVNTVLHEQSDTLSNLVKTNGAGSAVYGSCPFIQDPIGPDYYYKINLNQGDYLTATLKPAGTSTKKGDAKGINFYLLDVDGKTCITLAQASTPYKKLKDQDLTLKFQAHKGGDYYLVADSYNASITAEEAEFEIEYIVDSKGANNCVKYMTECKDANKQYVCEADGVAPIEVNCPFGCVGLACRSRSVTGTDSFDNCTSTTAPAYTSSVAIIFDDNDTSLAKDYSFSGANKCGNLTSNFSAKTDIFVKFDLQAGQHFNVIDQRSTHSLSMAYYVMPESACGSPPAYQCLDVKRLSGTYNDPGSMVRESKLSNYITSSSETLRLGMTATGTAYSYRNSAVAFVEVVAASCSPDSYSCTESGPLAEVTYCSSLTTSATFTCPGYSCNGRICEAELVGGGNTPYDAISLEDSAVWSTDSVTKVQTVVYDGSTQGLDHSYGGSSTGEPSGCHKSVTTGGNYLYTTAGRDAFHKITLKPGEKIDVTLTRTSASGDIAVYLLKLGDANLLPEKHELPMPTCYGSSDGGNVIDPFETFSYTYPSTSGADGEFLIVAGSNKTIAQMDHYDYKLTVKITPAP